MAVMTFNRRRGIALITVLMIMVLLMILVLSVLGLSSNNILYVASFRDRIAARYAAEAGVYHAVSELEKNPSFNPDSDSGYDPDPKKAIAMKNGASFALEVRPLGSSRFEVTSRGYVGPFHKTLRVEIEPSADAFNAISNAGPIQFSGDVFINGIRSLRNPGAETGNVHTNFQTRRIPSTEMAA
jgi:hypothetical protein